MEITAQAHYIRVSPRKMQLLTKSIKKMQPEQAVTTLSYIQKSGAIPLKKLINSALANAKVKNGGISFTFKHIQVLPGGAMKRFRAVSRGMAHSYKKRMSHVKIVLTDEKTRSVQPKIEKNVKTIEIEENSKSQIPNTKKSTK